MDRKNNARLKNQDFDNAWMFLTFMIENGFDYQNCKKILELIQSVPNSMSRYLKDYNQFLLSQQVSYSDLATYGVAGACGYLDKDNGILAYNCTLDDEDFRDYLETVSDKQAPKYVYPDITEFDSVIAYLDWTSFEDVSLLKQIVATIKYQIPKKYVGFIADKDEAIYEKVGVFSRILEAINLKSSDEYMLVHDTVSSKNKELYLIKKRLEVKEKQKEQEKYEWEDLFSNFGNFNK